MQRVFALGDFFFVRLLFDGVHALGDYTSPSLFTPPFSSSLVFSPMAKTGGKNRSNIDNGYNESNIVVGVLRAPRFCLPASKTHLEETIVQPRVP